MESILELEGVRKHYRDGFLLDGVSFSVPYGAIVGFVGANGAGKTTTIGCILGTLQRDGGAVRLFGQEMTDADTALRERIGVVYDGDTLPGYLTARTLGEILRGVYARWDDALYRAQLQALGLPPGRRIGAYSRGMTMKLSIAAALAHHPELLILDEATGGLDPIPVSYTHLDVYKRQLHPSRLPSRRPRSPPRRRAGTAAGRRRACRPS